MEKVLLDDFKIPPKPITVGDDGNGIFSCIYRGIKITSFEKMVNRKNICLKIFKQEYKEDLDTFYWGHDFHTKGSYLKEATHIQNIYAHHGLAPRVYKIVTVEIDEKLYWAYIVDDVGRYDGKEKIDQHKFFEEKIRPRADQYEIDVFDDGRAPNIVGEKYVDFQGFRRKERYEEQLKKKITGVANVGRWGPWQNYHDVLGLPHGRNTEHRIKALCLEEIDFEGKSFLDIGCSEGIFCHYAEEHGASRVVGIDLPGVVDNLWELASYLGHYNTDFYAMDLKNDPPPDLGTFDIIFFLSMGNHVGLPSWIIPMVDEMLVYEGNSRDVDKQHIKIIGDEMSIIKESLSEDLFKRQIIWGQKK
jgi:2-polyprenyl-3-methyl-5-hydroxy-6-metoxy-1,4-benzoquinol methylase